MLKIICYYRCLCSFNGRAVCYKLATIYGSTLLVWHNIKMLDKLSLAERTRQNRRKTPKSPINIRNKIKELEFQLEKNHKLKESHKHLQHAPLQPITHHTTTATQLTFRNHNSLKNKFNFKSEEKKEAATNKNERVTLVANQAPSR